MTYPNSNNIRIVYGDLFESKASCLICTVNLVGVMGAGVAKEFRDRHPDLYYRYKQLCRKHLLTIHTLMVYQPSNARYRVVMVPTKRHWKDSSRLDDVEESIRALAAWCNEHNVIDIAMPPLGCGNGGLDFESQVKPLIYRCFSGSNTQVEVYL